MGCDAQSTKIPIVEFNETNLSPNSSSWKSTADKVRRSLESYGCVVIDDKRSSSGCGSEPNDAVFKLMSEELFGLPLDTKMKHTSKLAGFGYGGNYVSMPLFECFGIEDGGNLEALKGFTNLMWPHGNDKFCETVYSYAKLLLDLDQIAIKMVTSSYGVEKYSESLIQSSFNMTRLLKYKKNKENESNICLKPHTDKGFITVVGSNEAQGLFEAKGLQLKIPNGEWVDFEPSPSKFLVIAGEALKAWSNGRIHSPLHRVISGGIKEKYSVGFFSFILGNLQVPKELVDDKNYPLKYKSFNNLEFLDYCANSGPTMEISIEKYCGI